MAFSTYCTTLVLLTCKMSRWIQRCMLLKAAVLALLSNAACTQLFFFFFPLFDSAAGETGPTYTVISLIGSACLCLFILGRAWWSETWCFYSWCTCCKHRKEMDQTWRWIFCWKKWNSYIHCWSSIINNEERCPTVRGAAVRPTNPVCLSCMWRPSRKRLFW